MMLSPVSQFFQEREDAVKEAALDRGLNKQSIDWMIAADRYKYTYNCTWMGRPIIKYPNDIIVQQELMWKIRPDLIIETGIAHGGSIIFSASMQKIMNIPNAEVVGIDIDIRLHNKKLSEDHIMYDGITMYEGDSTSKHILQQIDKHVQGKSTVMVILDSLHSHEHVLKELNAYSPFVGVGSYIVLPDTFIEFFPSGYYSNRPWDVGNNPYTAMKEFLNSNRDFEIDRYWSSKALITESIDGYLKRVA